MYMICKFQLVWFMHMRITAVLVNLAFSSCRMFLMTASVICWSQFLATDPEVPGSIPRATRFSEK
jgi:hypothetical protein